MAGFCVFSFCGSEIVVTDFRDVLDEFWAANCADDGRDVVEELCAATGAKVAPDCCALLTADDKFENLSVGVLSELRKSEIIFLARASSEMLSRETKESCAFGQDKSL